MKTERRVVARKEIVPITVNDLTSTDSHVCLASMGQLLDASHLGLSMQVRREDLMVDSLRRNLSLSAIEGQKVFFFLDEMNLELEGQITRTRYVGKGIFEVAIEFGPETPEYWRQCLIDLLPSPGELED